MYVKIEHFLGLLMHFFEENFIDNFFGYIFNRFYIISTISSKFQSRSTTHTHIHRKYKIYDALIKSITFCIQKVIKKWKFVRIQFIQPIPNWISRISTRTLETHQWALFTRARVKFHWQPWREYRARKTWNHN